MNILITGTRAPVALELARALGRAGHTVFSADSLPFTLGSCSRYVAGHTHLPPPRYAPTAFGRALLECVARQRIELIIPTCEEVFYLAQFHHALPACTRLFCEPLAALERWHNKYRFQQAAAGLGLLTPRTVLLRSRHELQAALPSFPRYLLKPAYSRFATRIVTNCGPRAAMLPLSACQPTARDPWLLQEYIDGQSVCSYSTVYNGHVTAHCAYATPYTVGQGAGVSFLSLVGEPTLAIVQRLVASGFTGQMSLDFIGTTTGQHYLLECNPRTTSAVHLMQPATLVGGLLDPQQPTWLEPGGRRRQLWLVALPVAFGRALHTGAWHELAAAGIPDVIASATDPLPMLAQLPQLLHFARLGRRKGVSALAATTDDIEWNGDADLYPPDT